MKKIALIAPLSWMAALPVHAVDLCQGLIPDQPNNPRPRPMGTLTKPGVGLQNAVTDPEPAFNKVTDLSLNVIKTINTSEPHEHAVTGLLANGRDAFHTVQFGTPLEGQMVTYDLTDTSVNGRVIVGPSTGYPDPQTTHLSAMTLQNPGWVMLSLNDGEGAVDGAGILDLELVFVDTATNRVCRVGHHRSWGKRNTTLSIDTYWAEPHATPSPTGTRVAFASDWNNTNQVDTYVIELPSYSQLGGDTLPPVRPSGLRIR
jgi:hypothetical protein